MGIASLTLGIASIVWSCFGGTWPSMMVGIVGIILGIIGRNKGEKVATTGLILSALGAGIGKMRFIVWFVSMGLAYFGF